MGCETLVAHTHNRTSQGAKIIVITHAQKRKVGFALMVQQQHGESMMKTSENRQLSGVFHGNLKYTGEKLGRFILCTLSSGGYYIIG